MMSTRQQGFTLIELVVVIVILGILAATALPKFVDMRSDAAKAATASVAGSITAAMTMNYAACVVSSGATGKCVTVNNCTVGSSLIQSWPSAYSISSLAVSGTGTVVSSCVVNGDSSTTASFTAIGY